MSFSLTKFSSKGELTVKSISTGGKVDGVKPGVTATLEASLPEEVTAKLSFTDGSIKSVRPRAGPPARAGVHA